MRVDGAQLPCTASRARLESLARADFFGVTMDACTQRTGFATAHALGRRGDRDKRIDFFRGLALLFIFVDHIPGNAWANYTLKNFGFCDASEVFVFLSGYAAALAYGRHGLNFEDVTARAYRRAATVYVWHIGVLITSALLLYAAAAAFANPDYVRNIAFGRFSDDPSGAILGTLLLTYQPNQMNILPMYVVLLLWFPLIVALLRKSVPATIALSAAVWAIANYFQLNLPVNQTGEEWYFNPLTWQLLFTTGAACAMVRRPIAPWVRGVCLGAALAYLGFCVLYAAPWTLYSWAPDGRPLPYGSVGEISKGYLSIWRYLNILALAYVVAEILPRTAAFLSQGWSRAIVACGQRSLQVFALGTILSFVGWIALTQFAGSPAAEAAINLAGLAVMGSAAVWLTARTPGSHRADPSQIQMQTTRA